MKNRIAFRLVAILAVAGSFGLPLTATAADILITELSTKSALNPEDYFELTNVGGSNFDVTGWKFDDEHASIVDAVPLVGITTIAPGESVVFFQLDETDPLDPAYDPIAETALFRSFWGGLAGVQVGYHAGAGLGKGDGITLFDAGNNQVLQLLYGMTSPSETHAGDWAAGNFDGSDIYENEAAVWVPGTDPQQFVLAAAGVYGSFANSAGEFGSPGTAAVPEPGTWAMLAVAGAWGGTSHRRRLRRV